MGDILAVDFKNRKMRRCMPTLQNSASHVDTLVKVLRNMGWEQARITGAVLAMVDFDRFVRSDMDTRRVVDRYLQLIGYA